MITRIFNKYRKESKIRIIFLEYFFSMNIDTRKEETLQQKKIP